MNVSFPIISIIGFLIISAFFSGSETAFFSLTKIQIKKIEKNSNQSSRRILRLLKNPRELLIIILLGNTIVNVAAASSAAYIAIEISENYFQQFQSLLIIIEIIIMTILLLIFGEIAPKLLAFSSPEKTARSSSLILEIIKYLLWPIIKILELISSIFSVNKSKIEQTDITSEDFKNLIQSKITQHSLEENEKRIINLEA